MEAPGMCRVRCQATCASVRFAPSCMQCGKFQDITEFDDVKRCVLMHCALPCWLSWSVGMCMYAETFQLSTARSSTQPPVITNNEATACPACRQCPLKPHHLQYGMCMPLSLSPPPAGHAAHSWPATACAAALSCRRGGSNSNSNTTTMTTWTQMKAWPAAAES